MLEQFDELKQLLNLSFHALYLLLLSLDGLFVLSRKLVLNFKSLLEFVVFSDCLFLDFMAVFSKQLLLEFLVLQLMYQHLDLLLVLLSLLLFYPRLEFQLLVF